MRTHRVAPSTGERRRDRSPDEPIEKRVLPLNSKCHFVISSKVLIVVDARNGDACTRTHYGSHRRARVFMYIHSAPSWRTRNDEADDFLVPMGDGHCFDVCRVIVKSMCQYLEASRMTTSEDRRWSNRRSRTMMP